MLVKVHNMVFLDCRLKYFKCNKMHYVCVSGDFSGFVDSILSGQFPVNDCVLLLAEEMATTGSLPVNGQTGDCTTFVMHYASWENYIISRHTGCCGHLNTCTVCMSCNNLVLVQFNQNLNEIYPQLHFFTTHSVKH